MMHHKATNAAPLPSLVDTFGSGFRAVNRILAVLIVPILVDLWLWLGPRLSVRPLMERLRAFNPAEWDRAWAQMRTVLPDDQPIDLRVVGQLPIWRRLHIFGTPLDAVQVVQPATWLIGDLLSLLGMLLLLNLALTFLTAVYLLPLADAVRGNPTAGGIGKRVLRAWLVMLAVIGMVLALFAVVAIPLLAVALVLMSIVPALGSAVVLLVFTAIVWVIFSMSFAYDAIVLDGAGPATALLVSVVVVRRYFWSVVGFFLLQTLMLQGLGVLWSGLISTVPGLLVAIVSSAYIGAGIAAAHLVFFRDRVPRTATLSRS
jgi:hypothetical protein